MAFRTSNAQNARKASPATLAAIRDVRGISATTHAPLSVIAQRATRPQAIAARIIGPFVTVTKHATFPLCQRLKVGAVKGKIPLQLGWRTNHARI